MKITFRRQVARKGSGEATRILLVVRPIKDFSRYDGLLAELAAAIGTEPLSLAALLDVQELLQAHASDIYGLAEQVMKRCLTLPPSPLHSAPHGF